jgi:hypothetical protein
VTPTSLLDRQAPASAADAPDLVIEGLGVERELSTRSGPVTLRLRRMAGRWLATAVGPLGETEVGADPSPYLAAKLALERWQPDTVPVLVAVGDMTELSR